MWIELDSSPVPDVNNGGAGLSSLDQNGNLLGALVGVSNIDRAGFIK